MINYKKIIRIATIAAFDFSQCVILMRRLGVSLLSKEVIMLKIAAVGAAAVFVSASSLAYAQASAV